MGSEPPGEGAHELVFFVDVVTLNSQTVSAANLGCWMHTTSAAAAFSAIPRPQLEMGDDFAGH